MTRNLRFPETKSFSTNVICINYEGGKIIRHALQSPYCIAYANFQIAMDAPFYGRVADEALRGKGRSELQFDKKYGYSDEKVASKLVSVIEYIQEHYPNKKIIMQIARGRAGIQMYEEVIKPLLFLYKLLNKKDDEPNPKKIKIVYGYKSKDYFDISKIKADFIFINIGMFAVLTEVDKINVGQICNPIITFDIKNHNLEYGNMSTFLSPENILNSFPSIPQIILLGIADDMPFITPEKYSKEEINNLIHQVIKEIK